MASAQTVAPAAASKHEFCADACESLGLKTVVQTVQKAWKDVSHTGFLGNMTDDSGAEHASGAEVLSNQKHWEQCHQDQTRRPSYHDPTSPTAAGAAAATEEGCAYSHEEEMAGRLHEEMLKESKQAAKEAA